MSQWFRRGMQLTSNNQSVVIRSIISLLWTELGLCHTLRLSMWLLQEYPFIYQLCSFWESSKINADNHLILDFLLQQQHLSAIHFGGTCPQRHQSPQTFVRTVPAPISRDGINSVWRWLLFYEAGPMNILRHDSLWEVLFLRVHWPLCVRLCPLSARSPRFLNKWI